MHSQGQKSQSRKVYIIVIVSILAIIFCTASNNNLDNSLNFLQDTALFSFGVIGMWITLLFPTILSISAKNSKDIQCQGNEQELKKQNHSIEIAEKLYDSLSLCIVLITILFIHHIIGIICPFIKVQIFSYFTCEEHVFIESILMRLYALYIAGLFCLQFYVFFSTLAPFSDTLDMIRDSKTMIKR